MKHGAAMSHCLRQWLPSLLCPLVSDRADVGALSGCPNAEAAMLQPFVEATQLDLELAPDKVEGACLGGDEVLLRSLCAAAPQRTRLQEVLQHSDDGGVIHLGRARVVGRVPAAAPLDALEELFLEGLWARSAAYLGCRASDLSKSLRHALLSKRAVLQCANAALATRCLLCSDSR